MQPQPKLFFREKSVLLLFLSILLSIALLTWTSHDEHTHDEPSTITIQLSGAVETPGLVELPAGTRWSDLPEHITLLPQASKRQFRRKKELYNEQQVHIEKRKK